MGPLVSIVMPVFNAEKFILESIDSVINQKYFNWELIIVDDCSADGTMDLVNIRLEYESRISLFQLDSNQGVAFCRNKAISSANGRFISFLDSDDLWEAEKLEKQVNFMLNNDFHFTYTAYKKIDHNGQINGQVGVPARLSYNDLLKTCYIGCLTAMYDSEKLGKVYMPSDTKREDYATWLNILKDTDYAYGINECLASYRVHPSQSSSKKINMAFENFLLYRKEERGWGRTVYYFINYAFRGYLRTKLPRLAILLGVLHKPKS